MSQQMVALINSFPVMRVKEIREWSGEFITDPKGLPAIYGPCSSGERRVIEFCLNVWNRDTDWTQLGYEQFNFASAWGTWSDKQRAPFLAWANDPFFP